jgi:hypothetical protein
MRSLCETRSWQSVWMTIPELVRRQAEAKVGAFCAGDTPRNVRDQVRLEFTTRGNAITIIERRAPWSEEFGSEWTSQPIAQLRFAPSPLSWSLWWSDQNDRWHRFDDLHPTPDIDVLIREIDADPTAIFWG